MTVVIEQQLQAARHAAALMRLSASLLLRHVCERKLYMCGCEEERHGEALDGAGALRGGVSRGGASLHSDHARGGRVRSAAVVLQDRAAQQEVVLLPRVVLGVTGLVVLRSTH